MGLFDLSNISGAFRPASADGGWASGTTTASPDGFFTRGVDGGIAGLTAGGQKSLGNAFQAAGHAVSPHDVAPVGAFGQGQDQSSKDPTAAVAPSLDWPGMIASWRKRINPGVV